MVSEVERGGGGDACRDDEKRGRNLGHPPLEQQQHSDGQGADEHRESMDLVEFAEELLELWEWILCGDRHTEQLAQLPADQDDRHAVQVPDEHGPAEVIRHPAQADDATHYRDGSHQEAQHRSQCGVGTRVAGGKRSDRDGDEERQGTFRTDDDLTGRAEEGVSHGWQQEGVEPSDRREPGEFGVRHGRWNGQSSHRHPCDDVVPPVPLGVSRHAGRDRERARQQWRLLPGSEG